MTLPIEIDAAELTSTAGGALLTRFGAILARDLYPREWVIEVGSRINQTYRLLGELRRRGALRELECRWLEARSFQVDLLSDLNGGVAEKLAAPVRPVAEAALGGHVEISPYSFVRRVEPDDEEAGAAHRLPFHQDQKILQSSLINIWAPFRDCGVTAPSLEVVARRLFTLEANQSHERNVYGQLGAEIPADQVLKSHGDALVAPTLSAGDALIFLGTTIHRTYIVPGMSERRDSVDLRLTRH